MENKKIQFLLISIVSTVLFVGAVFYLWPQFKKGAEPEVKTRLYFGFDLRISPEEDAALYQPLMEYLSEKTGYDFRLRFTREYESTQENLGLGYVHFAALGSVSFIKASRDYGAKILVRGLNEENKAEYQAAIFTYPESDIRSLEDIKGKSFAFGAKDSTQGHLIPRKMLDEVGISLNDIAKYEYTGSHKNVIDAIINRQFDAGGAQDTLVKKMADEGKIRIVKISDWYPSSGIAANKNVDSKIIEAVKKALLELDPRGKDKDILPNWDKTEMPNGFIEASEKDYSELKILMKQYEF